MAVFNAPRITTNQRTSLLLTESEIVYDIDLKVFFGGDGSSLGGFPIGKGNTGQGLYDVQIITLTTSNIQDGFVVLQKTPSSPEDVLLTPEGGIPQRYGVDYTVIGDRIYWSNLGLDGMLEPEEFIIVQIPTNEVYGVEYITLNSEDILNKYVTLPITPSSPTDVIVIPEGGVPQRYGIDFIIIGNKLSWNNLGLDGFLELNETITVQF